MAQKVKRFKQGSGVKSGSSGSESLRNLDYRLSDLSGGFGGSTGSGSTAARITPTAISQPSSSMASMAGQGPPKGYGFKLTKNFKKGGKLPDLTGDGKVTRADVLKGRGVPGFAKGSKVSAAEAVHKHERAKHKGQPLTKMAAGGSASKRGDGCATQGKTKGRMV